MKVVGRAGDITFAKFDYYVKVVQKFSSESDNCLPPTCDITFQIVLIQKKSPNQLFDLGKLCFHISTEEKVADTKIAGLFDFGRNILHIASGLEFSFSKNINLERDKKFSWNLSAAKSWNKS